MSPLSPLSPLTGVVEETSGGTVLMQATYTYDPLDRRIGVDETVSGTETKTWSVYDGQNVYADFNSSGTLLARYLDGPAVDQVIARTSASGTTAWYLTDDEGSVRDIGGSQRWGAKGVIAISWRRLGILGNILP